MATSAESPEYARQRRQWAACKELLPGIEEFLLETLAHEDLSSEAEEKRQYYVERLDILRLPPSLPPRAGKRLSVELLEESEVLCGTPSEQVPELRRSIPEASHPPHVPSPAILTAASSSETKLPETKSPEINDQKAKGEVEENEEEKDFAAVQRKISRTLLASVSSEVEGEEVEESDSAKGIKVYDDIDPSESSSKPPRGATAAGDDDQNDDDEEDDDGNALYEIPVLPRQLPPPSLPLPVASSEDNNNNSNSLSHSHNTDVSSLATAGSVDDISDDVLDPASTSTALHPPPPTALHPPPLPPRGRKRDADSASTTSLDRVGVGGAPVKPPDLPYRPPLAKRNEIYARSEKSEKSEGSDGDSTSYESFDDEHDNDIMNKLNIRLPKRPKKKSKGSGKLSALKARSSSTWEITSPFKKLENVVMSGEMYHKGKLGWNRRKVALSGGCLALYKPEKDVRPVLVIPLTGFSASPGDAVPKKGFEMKMSHPSGEAYTFTVDFKEWAVLWSEHINNTSQGLPVTTYLQHLARTFSGGSDKDTYGSKADLRSLDEGDYESYEDCLAPTTASQASISILPSAPASSPETASTTMITGAGTATHGVSVVGSVPQSPSSRRTGPHSPRFFQPFRHHGSATLGLFRSARSPSPSSPTASSTTASSSSTSSSWAAASPQPPRNLDRSSRTIFSDGRLRFCSLRSPPGTPKALKKVQGVLPDRGGSGSSSSLSSASRAASTLTLSRWDWKTLFYNWSFPLDQVILGLRRGNLSTSNSNLSISSEGMESDDSTKPKLRATKVMRMGSFAFRATQFFENLGKKGTTSKKKSSSYSTGSAGSQAEAADRSLRGDGIEEEGSSSVSSTSLNLNLSLSLNLLPQSPVSDSAASPAFEEARKRLSSSSALSASPAEEPPPLPTSPPPLPTSPPPPPPVSVKHQGYLYIFSTFNRRRWGKRWCLVKGNMFECYRDPQAPACELNFLLKNCVLRQALKETQSPLAIMLLENNREKLTVEPLTKEEVSQWLKVLMVETCTEAVPAGLEEYFVEGDEAEEEREEVFLGPEAEYTDIVTASVIRSWDVGSAPILSSSKDNRATPPPPPSPPQACSNPPVDEGWTGEGRRSRTSTLADLHEGDDDENESDDDDEEEADEKDDEEAGVSEAQGESYLYTEVVKRPSASSLDEMGTACRESRGPRHAGDNDDKEEVGAGSDSGRTDEGGQAGQACQAARVPRFTDNLAAYNANKNTTDSGFYSVRGANSDSSDSEDKGETISPGVTSSEAPSWVSGTDGGQGRGVSPSRDFRTTTFSLSPEGSRDNQKADTVSKESKQRLSDEDLQGDEEEEVEDGDLEKTLTPDDFRECVKRGLGRDVKGEDAMDAARKNECNQACPRNSDQACSNSASTAKDTVSVTNADTLQTDHKKAKKKKKKSKKSNRALKQQSSAEREVQPDVSRTNVTEADISALSSDSLPHQLLSPKDSLSIEAAYQGSQASSSSDVGACTRDSSSRDSQESDRIAGPDEDETIYELRDRIGRLREKLVQIKRKRIAVRDKRVRAFSPEERSACDKEFLLLEADCKETAAEIQALEQELHAAVTDP